MLAHSVYTGLRQNRYTGMDQDFKPLFNVELGKTTRVGVGSDRKLACHLESHRSLWHSDAINQSVGNI